MPYKNPEDQKAYLKKWNREFYLKNKAATYARVQARRQGLRDWLDDYKSKLSCSTCGEKHAACLDFHHKDSKTKEFSVAIIKAWGYSKERMLREIGKCVILCSNCHRKLHFEARKKK
ncbi:MAG TPA: hypothetical protein VGP13_00995 [Candidatus Paceibacterota bacterium]|jgi:hypothetical protein|nr:hypothetical protein [Candidatus Paceibacterota bacterium]